MGYVHIKDGDEPAHMFKCLVCGTREFKHSRIRLDSLWSIFKPKISCFTCERCGYIHHFQPIENDFKVYFKTDTL